MTFKQWEDQFETNLTDDQRQVARAAWNAALEHVMEKLVMMVDSSDGERSMILDEVENACDQLSSDTSPDTLEET